METPESAQAELLGVLADVLGPQEWRACSWLGAEAWLPCPFEVAGGLLLHDPEEVPKDLDELVARALECRYDEPVLAARRCVPGEGTVLVWYRHLN